MCMSFFFIFNAAARFCNCNCLRAWILFLWWSFTFAPVRLRCSLYPSWAWKHCHAWKPTSSWILVILDFFEVIGWSRSHLNILRSSRDFARDLMLAPCCCSCVKISSKHLLLRLNLKNNLSQKFDWFSQSIFSGFSSGGRLGFRGWLSFLVSGYILYLLW